MADNKFSYMDMPLQIGFQFAGPLDKYAQFDSLDDANTWKNGPLGYDGALVRIKTAENTETQTTTWKLYRVELENGEKVFKVIASDIELDAEGKIANSYLHTTADSADKANKVVVTENDGTIDSNLLGLETTVKGGEGEDNKFVLTADNGRVDNDILDSTVDTKAAGKVVLTDANGFVNTNLLDATVAGGTGNAGKIAKLGADGKLAESMIPSIAIGEYLGQFYSWKAFQAAITAYENGEETVSYEEDDLTFELNAVHAPENGDTVEIREGENGYSVFICVDHDKTELNDRFVTVKSAAGAVTEGAFAGHTSNTTIHTNADEKARWDGKLDQTDIVAGDNISITYGEDGLVTITGDADPYVLPVADADTLGGVMIGENVNVTTDGVISVNNATASQKGLVQPGTTLSVDANSVIDAKLATSTTAGIVKAGVALYVNDNTPGVINAQVATTEQLGVVKVGTNINVADGVISVATATADVLGLVKTGSVTATAIDVEGGLISVAKASTAQRGAVKVGTNIEVADGVISVKTGSESDLGVVQIGDGLNVTTAGVVSLDETTLVGKLDQKYYILKDGETQDGYQLLSDELLEKINEVNDWYDGGKTIQDASKTQKGVVQIGNNIDVTNGVISVATATDSTLGLVKSGTNVSIVDGALNVATATAGVLGVVKTGAVADTAMSVAADGTISVAVATDSQLGAVKVGENIDVADGVISLKKASKTNLGLMQVGSGLDVDDGVVSVSLWEKITGLELNAGATKDANKYKEWDKVCEVKIFDENGGIVFPSEYIVDIENGKTRIEFPADFATEDSGDGDTANWTVLVGPAIQ